MGGRTLSSTGANTALGEAMKSLYGPASTGDRAHRLQERRAGVHAARSTSASVIAANGTSFDGVDLDHAGADPVAATLRDLRPLPQPDRQGDVAGPDGCTPRALPADVA